MLGPARSTPSATRRRRVVRQVGRWGRRYRRWVGSGLVALGVWLAVSLATSPGPPTVTVATAAHDLAPGVRLTARDVVQANVPVAVAPATALTPDVVLGQTIAATRARGEILTSTAFAGSDRWRGAGGGTLALPLPLAVGASGLLVAGDRIDVLASVPTVDGSAVTVAAQDVVVLQAPASSEDDSAWWGDGNTSALPGARAAVVVAATPAQARALVAGASDGSLWPAVRPRS